MRNAGATTGAKALMKVTLNAATCEAPAVAGGVAFVACS